MSETSPTTETDAAPRPAATVAMMERRLVWHRRLVWAAAVVAIAINVLLGPPWWSGWVVVVLALTGFVHFMVVKTVTADEAWADGRSAFVHGRSYERAHIDSMLKRWNHVPRWRRREIARRRAMRAEREARAAARDSGSSPES